MKTPKKTFWEILGRPVYSEIQALTMFMLGILLGLLLMGGTKAAMVAGIMILGYILAMTRENWGNMRLIRHLKRFFLTDEIEEFEERKRRRQDTIEWLELDNLDWIDLDNPENDDEQDLKKSG